MLPNPLTMDDQVSTNSDWELWQPVVKGLKQPRQNKSHHKIRRLQQHQTARTQVLQPIVSEQLYYR